MGLFKNLRKRILHRGNSTGKAFYHCHFEEMESRRMMAAQPIHLGAVYYDNGQQDDQLPDVLTISFSGGAAGTQLTSVTIDGDKLGDGLNLGDCFFDTASGGKGVYNSFGPQVVEHNGFDVLGISVSDGGTVLTVNLSGFDAGEKLVLSIDVDEQGFSNASAVAEGAEFEGSVLVGTFTAPHYYDATLSDRFLDVYDQKLAGKNLNVPPDNYMPPGSQNQSVLTAGAVATRDQTPLPVQLSGTVFEDINADNVRQAGDPALAGVELTLLELVNGKYVATGLTTTTDANGYYHFDNLLPGTYSVVETQPGGYLSVGATAGNVGGSTRGSVDSPNSIVGVALLGGDNSVHNDFAEVRPASIAGRVNVDLNRNDLLDSGEPAIAGVTVKLFDGQGNLIATTQTNANGQYQFTNLKPGTYRVDEAQPADYFDGAEHLGSVGGSLADNDSMSGIALVSGTAATEYNFLEVAPAQLSGYVYVDDNNNGVKDPGEEGIPGAVVELRDANGALTGRTATTDAAGYYRFGNLMPGTYGLTELQPLGYFDGLDAAGSVGGIADNPGDAITQVVLASWDNGLNYNFGELRPGSISGRVHAERNLDCIPDPDEPLLAGVTIYLLDASGNRIAETNTDDQGYYTFTGLAPGVYGVEEVQPAGYLDGRDHVGSVGGQQVQNDQLIDINLGSGVAAVHYDFCELLPSSISGYVFQDGDSLSIEEGQPVPDPTTIRDGQFTADDMPLEGVMLTLADANGIPILDGDGNPIVTFTDANGYYEFTNLRFGVYTVLETQPDYYTDSIDTAGSTGGVADAVGGDAIRQINLAPGESSVMNNFSEILVLWTPPEIIPPPETPPELPPHPPEVFPPPPRAIPFDQPILAASFYPALVPMAPIELLMGGGATPPRGITWHLSVINGGQPRRTSDSTLLADSEASIYSNVAWKQGKLREGQWTFYDAKGNVLKRVAFGARHATPITGDWNGDGITDVGMFVDGQWFLDLNGNGAWDESDLWAQMGNQDDLPVTGDWDGDGKTDIGIFGPQWSGDDRALVHEPGEPDPQNFATNLRPARFKNMPPRPDEATNGWRTMKQSLQGKSRADLIDHVFRYGGSQDKPVAGDWNGDGISTIGVFRNGTWYLDVNGDGQFGPGDVSSQFGQPGDVPMVGDWNGDGTDKIGVFRDGTFYLDINGNGALDATDKVLQAGVAGDKPVVGDWNGDGIDDVGVYHEGEPTVTETASQTATPTEPDTATR